MTTTTTTPVMMSNKSKIRPRPLTWKCTTSTVAAMAATLWMAASCLTTSSTSGSSATVQAWQQPLTPRNRRAASSSMTSSITTTARQYAMETEIVAATAATTKPPRSMSQKAKIATKRRTKTVTQIHHSPSLLKTIADKNHSDKKGNGSHLLTREEEVLYAYRVRTLRAAIRIRDDLVHNGNSSNGDVTSNNNTNKRKVTETEWAAACGTTPRELRKWLVQGRQAREVLCAQNVGLVTSIAKKHYGRLKHATRGATILTLADMIQEGNLGLLAAAERFEPERGYRFSTYAVYWIRQRMLRAIEQSSRVIRLPSHVHGTLSKLQRYKVEFMTAQGRHPTPAELAQALDISQTKLAKLTQSSQAVVSLQTPLKASDDDTRTLGDALASAAPSPEEECWSSTMQADVQHVLQTVLTAIERSVVAQRFGFVGGKPLSVAATAQALDITSETVRLIEARALNKLRKSQSNFRLQDYVVSSSSHSNGSSGKATTMSSSSSSSTTRTTFPKIGKKKIWESSAWDPVGHTPVPATTPTSTTAAQQDKDYHHNSGTSTGSDRLWFF